MLILATSLRQIRIPELMELYAQSNEEKARDWPNLPHGFALNLAEQDFRQYLQEVFFRTPGALCALWEEKGRYASGLRLEPYRDGFLLEALETHPSMRKRGFASKLIHSVQQLEDKKIYSHVNKRNLASLKTHEKCGFVLISDHAVYIDGSVDYRCCTLVYDP